MFMLRAAGGESADQTRRRVIIVGVDASAEAEAAAQWAVREAELRKDDVLLVHAYKVPLVPASARAATVARGSQERQALLDRVAGSLVLPPTMHLDQLIEIDTPEYLLPRLSEQAELTVLGQDHPALGGHMPLGHTASTVASMSRHPVVAVPRGWTTRPHDQRPIAVAIDGRHPSRSTLGYAFIEASLRQVPVLVVHSAPLAELADGEQNTRLNLAEILPAGRQTIPTSLSTPCCSPVPRQHSRRGIGRSPAADCRRSLPGPGVDALDPFSRAPVLDRASCPVAVIPQQHTGLAMAD